MENESGLPGGLDEDLSLGRISGYEGAESIITARCDDIIWRARLDANAIVAKAEEYSQRIIAKASEKAVNDLNQAVEEGFAQGLEKGQAQALDMLKQQIDELKEINQQIEKSKAEILEDYEEDIKETALAIAKKIIDAELQKDDKAFLNLYKKAVQELSPQEWVKLTVSKFEESFASSNSELLRSLAKEAKTIKISVLENASPGTCIVETPKVLPMPA